jgi:hypothetical protein
VNSVASPSHSIGEPDANGWSRSVIIDAMKQQCRGLVMSLGWRSEVRASTSRAMPCGDREFVLIDQSTREHLRKRERYGVTVYLGRAVGLPGDQQEKPRIGCEASHF